MTASPAARKVLLIGWDAADWKVISPLIDAGKMPHLAQLVSDGAMGNLATLFPVLSPMLWTSIATGKRAYKHGIHGFAEPDPDTQGVRPITNLGRKCKAIWNILNQNGVRSNVVAWWPSNPVEPINGVMVSNHFQQAVAPPGKPWPLAAGTVHPRRLAESLASLRVHPGELEPDQILPFVPKAAEVDQQRDRRLASIAKILAETAGVQAAATEIMQTEPWDFMGVYFDGIDHFCHGFMQYRAPRLDWINERDFELYKEVVDTAYQFHDLMLGVLLKLAGEDTTVILVSDHGFHADHLRPRQLPNEPAGPADEHRRFGVFAIKGPGIKKDALVYGATLLDITPTILTLYGLPVGQDMDGKPLLGVFEEHPQVSYVDSWDAIPGEAGMLPSGARVDPVSAHEALAQLVELGYIEKPGEDKAVAVARTVRELRHNLARDYFGAARYPEAIRLFEELWEQYPEESRFGVKLVECHLALGQAAPARAALDRLVERKGKYAKVAQDELAKLAEQLKDTKPEHLTPEQRERLSYLRPRAGINQAAFAFLRARVFQVEGDHEKALEQFQLAESAEMLNRPSVYQGIGESLIELRRWGEAKQQFQEVLEIDPVNSYARLGLARCYLGLRRPRLALAEAMSSLGLMYHNPLAHFYCAQALRWLGRRDEAVRALQVAVAENPVFSDAHLELADLLRRLGRPEDAVQHQRLAVAARKRVEEFRERKPAPDEADLALEVDLTHTISLGNLRAAGSLPPVESEVVIVSGLPRSGTSMMMQMLAAGGLPVLSDGVREADADNPRGYYELEAAKKLGSDSTWLPTARGQAIKLVAQLLPSLPSTESYRIIFMERPLGELIDSQEAMLVRTGSNENGRSKRRLAKAYAEQLARVRKILEPHMDRVKVLGVNYHSALTDPVRTAADVNAFLGGVLDEVAMAKAVEPTLRRQFPAAA
jgi:predicted AlkP superfamily phosphohydrolase/phosphomutase/tetratricopeptide (TPR) repeat protein